MLILKFIYCRSENSFKNFNLKTFVYRSNILILLNYLFVWNTILFGDYALPFLFKYNNVKRKGDIFRVIVCIDINQLKAIPKG